MGFIKDIAVYILIVIIVIFVQRFVISPMEVNGKSMDSTLHDGDIMFMEKISIQRDTLERGDIVVFKYEGKYLIKRIVGLPGEVISAEDGKVKINGIYFEEPYLDGKSTNSFTTADFVEEEVPLEKFFLMGDNRGNSTDSRIFGYIDKNEILGRALITVFPFRNFGLTK